jgi:hypothetical protein
MKPTYLTHFRGDCGGIFGGELYIRGKASQTFWEPVSSRESFPKSLGSSFQAGKASQKVWEPISSRESFPKSLGSSFQVGKASQTFWEPISSRESFPNFLEPYRTLRMAIRSID